MAKGGRGRRTYNRDARGRFASGSSSGAPPIRRGAPKVTGGTLKARAGLARSRRRLAAADPADVTIKGTLSRRSQRGAVTRGKNALAQAKKESRVRLAIGPKKGTIRKPKGGKSKAGGPVKTAIQKRADALLRVHGPRLITEELSLRQKRRGKGGEAERRRIREDIASMTPEAQIAVIKRFVAGRRELVRPKVRRPKQVKARVDGNAFSQRFSRAGETWRRRYLSERNREDAMSSSERVAIPYERRFASSQRREERSRRTAQAAMEFYRMYGSPSAFGMRRVEKTSSSPRFGSKSRRKRKR